MRKRIGMCRSYHLSIYTYPLYDRTRPIKLMSDQDDVKKSPSGQEVQRQKELCDSYVASGLTWNVTVKFLMENLVKMGCRPPSRFIRCIDCGDTKAGGGFGILEEEVIAHDNSKQFESKVCDVMRTTSPHQQSLSKKLVPEIFLCQQHLVNEQHAHESLVHELIHAIDLCRTNMDPINNCIHMACTEIRAENLSGECSWSRELINGKMKSFAGHGAECVKRRAKLSVENNPKCRERASEYVDAAFDRCFRDTFPFDRHPNLR